MTERKACLKLMVATRADCLACLTMKDESRASHLAGIMAVMKDALINLVFHLAVT